MKYMICHRDTKNTTWFGLVSTVESKSDQDCVFDSPKLNNHAMTDLVEHFIHSRRDTRSVVRQVKKPVES